MDFTKCHAIAIFKLKLDVGHMADVPLLFDTPLMLSLDDANDIKVSKLMIDLWTSFASSGSA